MLMATDPDVVRAPPDPQQVREMSWISFLASEHSHQKTSQTHLGRPLQVDQQSASLVMEQQAQHLRQEAHQLHQMYIEECGVQDPVPGHTDCDMCL